jgi:hypothetical protein
MQQAPRYRSSLISSSKNLWSISQQQLRLIAYQESMVSPCDITELMQALTSDLPGVIGKLVKEESQLRGEVVALIAQKLRTFSRITGSARMRG